MPGLAQKNNSENNNNYHNLSVGNGTVSFPAINESSISNCNGSGFWSKHRDDISFNQLQKFWSELTPQARKGLLRIDKQTLFEQARKNMYCSRCNGLLLEAFLQIVMYGKSLQQDTAGGNHSIKAIKNQNDDEFCSTNAHQEDLKDPSVHPWGGLITSRDGMLTLLNCYLYAKSLKGLQNVFDSARARERERELLYPDACGGGGRGWISQGMVGYGRGHGMRDTCALHTARLSVDTLVDFWSALGEETRQSLLRMKEEDFIERLMYRFDSKRFCRDCRRNVIREFKELKELKRMRREPRCTTCFCVADTAFQYEVSHDTVQADWHQTFLDSFGTYHHFEWAIGTGEGKSDILEFENVGLSGKVQVNGLDLGGLNACYITLRAWKMDGRCTELCVKAHALRGQQCVHCSLAVGDGFVTITTGESIRRFFEHAEEADEEEDDDSMERDGNDLDSECSRPQKHAKSPELAREFLLDAATVIFKEQVEKAFREGTARQNAHSIFVCLALKLLEERVHVACKEIITLEKQMKLLEEEEKEKREERERKERRRNKEREKKLRRKERLREKENREKKCVESDRDSVVLDVTRGDVAPYIDEDVNIFSNAESASEAGEVIQPNALSPEIQDDQQFSKFIYSRMEDCYDETPGGESYNTREWNSYYTNNPIKYSRRKTKFQKDAQQCTNSDRRKVTAVSVCDSFVSKLEARYFGESFEDSRSNNGFNKQVRSSLAKSNVKNSGSMFNEKLQCTNNRIGERYDACSCSHHGTDYRGRSEFRTTRLVQEPKHVHKMEHPKDMLKPYNRGSKHNQVDYSCAMNGRSKSKVVAGNMALITKKVWEPLGSMKKFIRSNSDSDVTLRSTLKVNSNESGQLHESSSATSSDEVTDASIQNNHEDNDLQDLTNLSTENGGNRQSIFHPVAKSEHYLDEVAEENVRDGMLDSCTSSSSNSDNCSSSLSEGDSNASASNPQNAESTYTSDSEVTSQKETSCCQKTSLDDCQKVVLDDRQSSERREDVNRQSLNSLVASTLDSVPMKSAPYGNNMRANFTIGAQTQSGHPQLHSQSVHYSPFQAPSMGYYHQNPVSWPIGPPNGLTSFPHPSPYLFTCPFGYGLSGNSGLMQYGRLQHPGPAPINPTNMPTFPPLAQANGNFTKEPAKVFSLGGQKLAQTDMQKVGSVQRPAQTPPVNETQQIGKPDKLEMQEKGFSLFHFGGPVALSAGFQSDPVSLKDGISANHSDGGHACKKDPIEEYNLFATSNGIKFSIF